MLRCTDSLELIVLKVLSSNVGRVEIYWMYQAGDAKALFY